MRIKYKVRVWFAIMALLSVNISSAAVAGFADAVASSRHAVVNIFITQKEAVNNQQILEHPILRFYFGEQMPQQHPQERSLGSGVLVDKMGHILTNYHVVAGASKVEVALSDGRRVDAKLIGADAPTDVAVLQIKAKNLHPIALANIKNLQVGDIVLAIGNPFGLGQTVTQGIVSAIGRDSLGINQFENFIQTDAAINPGNSGGALITSDGHLIGINSAIFSRSGGNQGIGFAIPIDLAQQVMDEIITSGKVVRGWLGISIVAMDDSVAKEMQTKQTTGIGVAAVAVGSPAYTSGLRVGDVIIQADGKQYIDAQNFMQHVAAMQPGKVLPLVVLRAGEKVKYKVKIGERKHTSSANSQWETFRQQPMSRLR